MLLHKSWTPWMKHCAGLTLAVVASGGASSADAQNVRAREDITRAVTVEQVAVVNGTVSGEVHNQSSHILRDVQLFIRYTWLWDNETKPGAADPGTSAYYTLPTEIPAGGRLPFTYKPPAPLPKVPGGRFETSVTIAGFTEVIPQTQ